MGFRKEREKALSDDCYDLSFLGFDVSGGNTTAFRICNSLGFSPRCSYGSSGCLGCDTKHKLISSIDEPLKGQESQARSASKPCIVEDFWTTSTCDMDNSAVHSRGSISSMGTSNQTLDAHGTGSGSISQEFINHGFLLWNQTRQLWIGNRRPDNQSQQLREPKSSWNATYDSLLGSNKPFAKPVPLSEMVDFLVDIWEQEGMYD